jgi:hypothetical protein
MSAHGKYGTFQLEDKPEGENYPVVMHVHGRKFMTGAQRTKKGWPAERVMRSTKAVIMQRKAGEATAKREKKEEEERRAEAGRAVGGAC